MTSARAVLVGGAPGVGKTTLARGLAARRGAVPLTADDAQAAVKAVTTPDSHPALHHERAAGGHVSYFTQTPPDRLIADALDREQAMWPVIDAAPQVTPQTGASVVIDWWLHRPSQVAGLDDVASIWIHLEEAALWNRERRNTDWVAGSSDPERMLANFMARSLWRNDLIADEAERHGLPLMRLSGTESPDEVADRAESLLRPGGV